MNGCLEIWRALILNAAQRQALRRRPSQLTPPEASRDGWLRPAGKFAVATNRRTPINFFCIPGASGWNDIGNAIVGLRVFFDLRRQAGCFSPRSAGFA
jgi:hypothetical protein